MTARETKQREREKRKKKEAKTTKKAKAQKIRRSILPRPPIGGSGEPRVWSALQLSLKREKASYGDSYRVPFRTKGDAPQHNKSTRTPQKRTRTRTKKFPRIGRSCQSSSQGRFVERFFLPLLRDSDSSFSFCVCFVSFWVCCCLVACLWLESCLGRSCAAWLQEHRIRMFTLTR